MQRISFVPVSNDRFEVQGADPWNRFQCIGFVSISPLYKDGKFIGKVAWMALDKRGESLMTLRDGLATRIVQPFDDAWRASLYVVDHYNR